LLLLDLPQPDLETETDLEPAAETEPDPAALPGDLYAFGCSFGVETPDDAAQLWLAPSRTLGRPFTLSIFTLSIASVVSVATVDTNSFKSDFMLSSI
jgi:hypothetical protein